MGDIRESVAYSEKGQAMPAVVRQVGPEAFGPIDRTEVRWLGSASLMVNSRGTTILIDPLLEGFDMPLLFEPPLAVADVPHVDAILITHIDNDHFSRDTCGDLKGVCDVFHAPQYVAEVMREEGLDAVGHDIGEAFAVGDLRVTLTPAEHNWQNEVAKWAYREWKLEDYCGFWVETPDGTVWTPGDSRLLPEQLAMPSQPDLIFMDFADNGWHITFDGAVELANAYPEAELVLIHWGSVDAPDWNTFNGDPVKLAGAVVNAGRVHALAPGEALALDSNPDGDSVAI